MILPFNQKPNPRRLSEVNTEEDDYLLTNTEKDETMNLHKVIFKIDEVEH